MELRREFRGIGTQYNAAPDQFCPRNDARPLTYRLSGDPPPRWTNEAGALPAGRPLERRVGRLLHRRRFRWCPLGVRHGGATACSLVLAKAVSERLQVVATGGEQLLSGRSNFGNDLVLPRLRILLGMFHSQAPISSSGVHKTGGS